jgi:hypothetical protein
VSLLSIWFPLVSNTLISLKSISTGSEKNTITSVVPVSALDVKLGIVCSVNGCAAANGIDIDDKIRKIIRNFLI